MEPKLALGAAFITSFMLLAGASAVFAYDANDPVRLGETSEFAAYAGTAMGYFAAIRSEVVDTLGSLDTPGTDDDALFAKSTAHTMWSMTKLKASVTEALNNADSFSTYTATVMRNMTSIKSEVTDILAGNPGVSTSDEFSQATAGIMQNMMNIKGEVVKILWETSGSVGDLLPKQALI